MLRTHSGSSVEGGLEGTSVVPVRSDDGSAPEGGSGDGENETDGSFI